MRRRHRTLGVAAALGSATLLGLLAAGSFSVGHDVAEASGGRPHGVPAQVAARLVGAGNFLAFGEALRLLRQPAEGEGAVGAELRRRRAEEMLARLGESGPAPSRSRALNLLAVLRLADAAAAGAQSPGDLAAAVESFARAARLDPANEDAKYNLELLLTIPGGRAAGAVARSGRSHPRKSTGGAGDAGSGY